MALIDTEAGRQALKGTKRRPYSTPVITDLEPGSDKVVQLTAILTEESTPAKCVQCGERPMEDLGSGLVGPFCSTTCAENAGKDPPPFRVVEYTVEDVYIDMPVREDEEYEMSSTTDFEPPIPAARAHPTIYLVHLGRLESAKWETDAVYRAERTEVWLKAARALKKRTIEVHGRYCQLATINVEGS